MEYLHINEWMNEWMMNNVIDLYSILNDLLNFQYKIQIANGHFFLFAIETNK